MNSYFGDQTAKLTVELIENTRSQKIRDFFYALKPENQRVIRNLCSLCQEAAKRSEENLMPLENIVMVIGPSISRIDQELARKNFEKVLDLLPEE